MPGCCGHLRQTSIRSTATNKSNIPALESKTTKLSHNHSSQFHQFNPTSQTFKSSIKMSLIGHHGGLSIGKAERPGPSLGKKINKDHQSKSDKSSSSFSQMIGGMLHSQRRGEDRCETASISSVATEKRALLGEKSKSSSSRQTPKLVNPNETLMPPARFWS